MLQNPEKLGTIAAAIAFLLCLVGGLVVICSACGLLDDDQFIWVGMGMYFMGKAFFVGPMLLLASKAVRIQGN